MRNSESKGKFDLSNVPVWVHVLIIGIIAAVVIFSIVKHVIKNISFLYAKNVSINAIKAI